MPDMAKKITPGFQALLVIISILTAFVSISYLPMQCVEHVVALRIANLRVQKPENAPFLPSENRFSWPSRACVFVSAKLAIFNEIS